MNTLKRLLNPVSLSMLAVALGAGAFNRVEIAALAFLGFLGTATFFALKGQQTLDSRSPLDQVSNNNRARLRPISTLKTEIDTFVSANRKSSLLAAMGGEVQKEANSILTHCVELLDLREKLQDVVNSSAALDVAEDSAQDAHSESIRATLSQARENIEKVDSYLDQAKTVLSEMRTRLAFAASEDQAGAEEGMREALLNSKALSATFDEAEAFLKGEA